MIPRDQDFYFQDFVSATPANSRILKIPRGNLAEFVGGFLIGEETFMRKVFRELITCSVFAEIPGSF